MSITTTNLTPTIGTAISVDHSSLLSGVHALQLRRLLEERGVLIFREIQLADEQQVKVATSLGNVREEGKDGIFKVTLDPKENTRADYLLGAFHWHIDGTHDDVPVLASLLSGRKLSPTGGQTEFANTYAAYEALPENEQRELNTTRVVHTVESSQRAVYPNPTTEQIEGWRRYPPKVHPLVWTHRSGRKSLVLGSHASHIEGMPVAEGRALIKRLMDWVTQPRFVYRHEWKLGDMLIWDNTGTMHRVLPYDVHSGRTMHRTTLLGEEALV
jgi:alpha-ketoglutarate-dependent taurine dioxygenase